MNAALQVRAVRKGFRTGRGTLEAIGDVTLDIAPGRFISVVGPSGCGKSTLLQIMAGLLPASGGQVLLNDRMVTTPPPEAIYVFQQYAKSVYPWKSVIANVMFGIKHRPPVNGHRPHHAAIEARCLQMLDLVGLRDFKDYYPYQLSGGMQQRVAIARALVCQPEVLLMDEPLGALDALTRTDLQDAILALWAELRPTIVFVTHDIDEAIYLSEEVVVLTRSPARVSQIIPIALEYPRHQIETRELPAYLDYRRRILADITRRETVSA